MLNLKWKRGTNVLYVEGEREIDCSCRVRNRDNGKRRPWEVVRTMPDGKPYQPQEFPVGKWEVGEPLPRNSPELAPFFIPTNAWLEVNVWSLKNGSYDKETEEKVIDRSYGLHYSGYSTTLGCIKIESRDDLLWLADRVRRELRKDEKVYLTVEDKDAAKEGQE